MTDGRTRDPDRALDWAASWLLVALALAGAYYHLSLIVALAATAFVTLRVARFWSSHSLDAVGYEREASDDRAFPGDELLLTLRLSNAKLLPMPWVEVDDRIPDQLAPVSLRSGRRTSAESDRVKLVGSAYWHQRLVWRYRLRCQRRGIYPLGPALVSSGDPFGLFPRWMKVASRQRVVVYPRLIPVEQLGLPPGFPLGDSKSERWIFEDPSRTAGVRDYRHEDPIRRIHWKATARRQELQVKLLEPTTTLEVALVLALDTFAGSPHLPLGEPNLPLPMGEGRSEGTRHSGLRTQDSGLRTEDPALSTQHSALTPDTDPFEHAVSLVASLAHLLIGQRRPVGLYLNGGARGCSEPVEFPPGRSEDQLMAVLELLAGVEPVPCVAAESLLARVAPRLPWGSCVILVVGSLTETLLPALHQLRGTGRNPIVVCVAENPSPHAWDGIPVHVVAR